MIKVIYHSSCQKTPDGVAPEFVWDGFSMAGGAGYQCEACGESLMIFDESDRETKERLNGSKNTS